MAHDVQDFQSEVVEKSRTTPVVVDFWAAWCGPCKVLGPILEKLEAESGSRWTLAKVDTDRNPELSREFGIRGIPAVKLFVDGKVKAEFTGAMPEPGVRKWLAEHLPDPDAPVLEEIRQLVSEGKGAAEEETLRAMLLKSPDNHKVRILLARVVMENHPDEAGLLLKPIEQDSKEFLEAEALRTHLRFARVLNDASSLAEDPVKPLYLEATRSAVEGRYEQALDRFIEVIRANRYYDDDGARRACVAIFTLLGDDHPLVRAKRREFSGALY
jgi:putative thioredoxin